MIRIEIKKLKHIDRESLKLHEAGIKASEASELLTPTHSFHARGELP